MKAGRQKDVCPWPQVAVHGDSSGAGSRIAFANGTCAADCRSTLLARFAERQRLLESHPETRRCSADERRRAGATTRAATRAAAPRPRVRRREAAAAMTSSVMDVPGVSLD